MPVRTYDVSLPDLRGRRAVVTGASDGIGLVIATRLAGAGAEVVMPVRNPAKGSVARQRIREQHPDATVELAELDLASLASVRAFGAQLCDSGRPVHLLINNAGLMTPPERQVTADGFEIQFGTNHLGHFALTAALLPALIEGRARVTTQTSIAARRAAIDFDDLDGERRYDAMRSYGGSKLACALFGLELARRSHSAGWGITSTISHPGVAPTSLLAARPELGRGGDTREVRLIRWLSAHGLAVGTVPSAALPALMAATTTIDGDDFFGPQWPGNAGGPPGRQKLWAPMTSTSDASRLWAVSEERTSAFRA